MKVEETRIGRAWRLWRDDGQEMGIILRALVRSARPMYAAYSRRDGTHRWDLGASTDWEERVAKVIEFDPAEPGVAVRVSADVIDRIAYPRR